MEFDPNNHVIKRCVQGMDMEAKGGDAGGIFMQAWDEATNDFERFIAAHFVAKQQRDVHDKLTWLETVLRFALKVNNELVRSAFPALYLNIAQCYEEIGDSDNAKKNRELSVSSMDKPGDNGPFYHGTRADLKVGDMLAAGYTSNYNPEVTMNHIYFTAGINGAGLAAALAKGEGRERVYIVSPTGSYENDPNVTDKKFPGNPTRSYRSTAPLEIIGEVTEWSRLTPEQLQAWREKLANNKGAIIN